MLEPKKRSIASLSLRFLYVWISDGFMEALYLARGERLLLAELERLLQNARMDLDAFLKQEDSPKPAALAKRIGVSNDQLRQWRFAYGNRRPSPSKCVDIEVASQMSVRRWDLRPDDWHRIWPELIGTEGAPSVPAESGEAAHG